MATKMKKIKMMDASGVYHEFTLAQVKAVVEAHRQLGKNNGDNIVGVGYTMIWYYNKEGKLILAHIKARWANAMIVILPDNSIYHPLNEMGGRFEFCGASIFRRKLAKEKA